MDDRRADRYGCRPMTPPHPPHAPPNHSRLQVLLAVLTGGLLSVVLSGYQVGRSNHTVYLLDAFRRADPDLLARDWFTTQTLQYHGLFSILTRGLLELGGDRLMAAAFLVGFLLTMLALHYFGWRIVRALGGGPSTYLLACVFFHLSAAGTGLGGFQFLQDGAFLPSNVANVALLGGIATLMEGRLWLAALSLGVAAIFHINHAVIAPAIMVVGTMAQPGIGVLLWRSWQRWIGPALLLAAAVSANLLPALLHLRGYRPPESLPLREFIELYARLRHPHHYYPPAWGLGLFVVSLWSTLPAAWVLLERGYRLPDGPRRVLIAVWWLLAGCVMLALLLAGVWFISERLVQLALFRFSIHWMFLACAVLAWGVVDSRWMRPQLRRWLLGGLVAVLAATYVLSVTGFAGSFVQDFVAARTAPLLLAATVMAAACLWAGWARPLPPVLVTAGCIVVLLTGAIAWGRATGLGYIPDDPPAYRQLARWARDHTPKDALFLVPPGEQSWRIDALRAIVINVKGIPQTRAEMPEWKRRMQDVTGEPDLMRFASTFSRTLTAVDASYDALSSEHLRDIARRYDCQYVVTRVKLEKIAGLEEVAAASDVAPPYRMYAVVPVSPPSPTTLP